MNTLIVYSTKHGAAKNCAHILAEKLTGRVDLHNIKEGQMPELSQYHKIIIGGSIYVGKISKELSEFCSKNLSALKDKKIGFYICCMNHKEADKEISFNFPEELLRGAVVKKSFGGEFKFKEMNFFERLMTRMVAKILEKEDPSLAIDMKKDVSMLSEKDIEDFAKLMNNAV